MDLNQPALKKAMPKHAISPIVGAAILLAGTSIPSLAQSQYYGYQPRYGQQPAYGQPSQIGGDISNQLNRKLVSSASKPSLGTPTRSGLTTVQVGVLFFRGDGGDPKELRVEDDTLVLIAARDGSGYVYQNGYPVDIHPAIRESAGEIAVAMFRTSTGAQMPISELPVPAQRALSRFSETGVKPRVMFARITNREDTAKVADIRATQILSADTWARVADRTGTVDLVKTTMRTFGLKSDVCDNSVDSRCNRPGVREAFAQIKREEAFGRLAAQR